uniref:Coiled-coil domain containing 14 n=1 Tax=Salvator merianae TaxID=96440 RepID=A0A8D0C966_SALMN
MARQGCGRQKVLSSGRLTGPAKLTNGKKQIAQRKVAHSDADSGYSLYSTDSEDQVGTIHHGLDRCAALLKDILQNESEGVETICRKAEKVATVRTTSRPLLNKGNGLKKRGLRKKMFPTNVHKETVALSKKKSDFANAAPVEKDTTPVTTEKVPSVQPIHVPCNLHSPVMHQKLCEYVQTQMSLLNIQPPQKSSGNSEVPLSVASENAGCQPVTAFNSRLPTSTPALSPQQAPNLPIVHSGIPMDNCSQCASQRGGTLLPAGSGASTCASQEQSTAICSALPHVIHPVPKDTTASVALAPASNKGAVPDQGNHEQRLKEADLIRCIQAHLALLQACEKDCGKYNENQNVDPMQSKTLECREEEITEEYSEGVSEEEDSDGVDMAPVRDTNCQASFNKEAMKQNKTCLQKTAQKVKTVKYLLGELKALLTDHGDSEILRLLGEVEESVSRLPAAIENTNMQAEIALALQPLRSENAQLRRQLRILKQQLKNQEKAEKECNVDTNYEFVSLQSLNMTLQTQLNESMKSIELLQNKNEEFIKILENQKEENKRLTQIIHEREQDLLEKRQQFEIDATKLKIEADEMVSNIKSFQYKLDAAEKENQILGITLRQRDAEVNRLRELTRALQGSMSKLLSDLTVDASKPKQEKSLSKTLLELHEKQLQSDTYPLSDSIMTYLKKLESNPEFVSEELLFTKSDMMEPNQVCNVKVTEQTSPKSPILAAAMVAQKNVFTLLKPEVETASNWSSVIDSHEPDETLYIPLSSSLSHKPLPAAGRRMQAQPQGPPSVECDFKVAETKQSSKLGLVGESNTFNKFCASFSPKKTVENKCETMERTAKLEGRRLKMQPKEITHEAAKVILENPDRLHFDKFSYTPISHQKGSVQKKGAGGISAPDSSFSTFDWMSGKSEWTVSSFSTFTSRDEEDFKNGLAALDANIARLQKTLQNSLKKTSPQSTSSA